MHDYLWRASRHANEFSFLFLKLDRGPYALWLSFRRIPGTVFDPPRRELFRGDECELIFPNSGMEIEPPMHSTSGQFAYNYKLSFPLFPDIRLALSLHWKIKHPGKQAIEFETTPIRFGSNV